MEFFTVFCEKVGIFIVYHEESLELLDFRWLSTGKFGFLFYFRPYFWFGFEFFFFPFFDDCFVLCMVLCLIGNMGCNSGF